MERFIYEVTCDLCKRTEQIEIAFSCWAEGDDIESASRSRMWDEKECYVSNHMSDTMKDICEATGHKNEDVCSRCYEKLDKEKVEAEERAEYDRFMALHKKFGVKKIKCKR